jgi:hypothetical protein
VDGVVDQTISYDWTRSTPRTSTYLFDGDIDGNGLVDARDTRTLVQISWAAGRSPAAPPSALQNERGRPSPGTFLK